MSSVDDRVVNMQFNNAEFQSGVDETLTSLDKLKAGLNLAGAGKGLDNLNTADVNNKINQIAENTDKVSDSFSNLGIVGNIVLYNLGYKAISVASTILKNMTIGPVIAGFQQYSSKMQTMMELTTALGDNAKSAIASSMNTLNVYAEKTVYNVADMNSALGQMVSQGINIKDATTAIIGFGNAAASAGVSTQTYSSEISTALVPALALGKLQGQNWLQLKQSGIATAAFQQALIKAAQAQGLNIKTTAQFNAALNAGTINTKIMINALKSLATNSSLLADAENFHTWSEVWGAVTSGMVTDWSDFWQSMIGDADAATPMFTELGNALTGLEDKYDTTLTNIGKNFNLFGGMTATIDAVKYSWRDFLEVIDPVRAAFASVFPTNFGTVMANMATAAANFFWAFKLGTPAATELENAFKGLFAIFDLFHQLMQGVGIVLKEVFQAMDPGASAALKVSGGVGLMIYNFDQAVKSGGFLVTFFTDLGKVIALPIKLLTNFSGTIEQAYDAIKNFDLSSFTSGIGKATVSFAPFERAGERIAQIWSAWTPVFKAVWGFIEPILSGLAQQFENLGTSIATALQNGDWDAVLDTINTGLFAAMTALVAKFLKNGFKVDIGGGFFGSISEGFEELTNTLSAMQLKLKADALVRIAAAVAVLTASIVALSLINSGKLTVALGAITVMFGQLAGAMSVMTKVSSVVGAGKMTLVSAALIVLATAIDVLAIAVATMGHLSWDQLTKGLTGVTVVLGELVTATQLMPKNPFLIATAQAMLTMSFALNALAGAVAVMGNLSWDALSKGLTGVGAGLGFMVTALNLMPKNPLLIATAGAMVVMGASLAELAGVMKIMGTLNWDQIAKGLSSIAVGLGIMVTAINLMPKSPLLVATAAALVIMGLALGELAGSMKIMGTLTWSQIGKGLTVMAAGLLIMVAALTVMPSNPLLLVTAVALNLVASSIVILAEAMKIMGTLTWSEVGKGLTVMAGGLTLMVAALIVMGPQSIIAAAGLVVAATGVAALAGAMKVMGSMTWVAIAKSMVALAGGLVILAAGMIALLPALPGAAALNVIAAGLAIFVPILILLGTQSWSTIGTGLGGLAAALGILGAAGILLLPAIPGLLGLGTAITLIGIGTAAAGVGLLAFSTAMATFIAIGPAAALAMQAMLLTIIGLIPTAAAALATGAVTFATTLLGEGGQLLTSMETFLNLILTAISNESPKIIATLFNLSLEMLNAINSHTPEFETIGIDILVKLLNGLASRMGSLTGAGANVIIAFIDGLSTNGVRIANAGAQAVVDFVNGIAGAIRSHQGEMNAAGLNLAGALADGITGGLASKVAGVVSSAFSLGEKAVKAIQDAIDSHSPSKETYKLGGFFGDGFIGGINDSSVQAQASAANMGNAAMSALQSSVSGVGQGMYLSTQLQPTITPVLDLTQVKKQSNQIGGMLNTTPLSVKAQYATASSIAATAASPSTTTVTDPNGVDVATSNGGVTFVQNNTSPVALSTADIYRQTKNGLSTLKAALKG